MAENAEVLETTTDDLSYEQKVFANNMAASLDASVELPYNFDESASVNTEAAENKTIPTTENVAFDEISFAKENFGFESLDEVKAEWKRLIQLKENPPQQLHDIAQIKEAASILERKERIAALVDGEITNELAANIIKQSISEKYSSLSKQEIDRKFVKEFGLPKEPVQLVSEEDTDYEDRLNEWKEKCESINTDMVIEAKVLRPELSKIGNDLKLPEAQKQEIQLDEDYEAYKSSLDETSKKISTVIKPALESLKSEELKLAFQVSDANNQMDFSLLLEPTAEQFKEAVQDSLNFTNFVRKVSYDENGNFKPNQLVELILLYNNKEKYFQSSARQAVNEERKRVTAIEVNGGSANRDYSQSQKTPLQEAMDKQFI